MSSIPSMTIYFPNNWYWIIGDEENNKIFSSSKAKYVSIGNTDYNEWLARGNVPTKITSSEELYNTLTQQLPGIDFSSLLET